MASEELTDIESTDKADRPIRLVGRKQWTWIAIALVGGVGMNAYRTYRSEGRLDATWYVSGAITVVIAGVIMFAITRYANRPESD